jgi:hypothetical protein
MSELKVSEQEVFVHELKTTCQEGDHDWSGPGYERECEGGGFESGATCAKCGMEFGHWALFNFD